MQVCVCACVCVHMCVHVRVCGYLCAIIYKILFLSFLFIHSSSSLERPTLNTTKIGLMREAVLQ